MQKEKRLEDILSIIIPTVILIVMALYFLDVRNRAGRYDGVLISGIFYLLVVTYILIIIEEYIKYSKRADRDKIFTKNQIFLVIAMILFIPLQKIMGFILSVFIFTLTVQTKIGIKKWSTRLFLSLLLSLGLWFIFSVMLNVKLPSGILRF